MSDLSPTPSKDIYPGPAKAPTTMLTTFPSKENLDDREIEQVEQQDLFDACFSPKKSIFFIAQ
eukprot:CAMPEP_0194290426 /NCGR_PEP_ID=MMETSP0169-20130528/41228_1 /TAXON_ID=218684 /ORGANISM="Corethron pennatum, Strain L29A3" /LENGTH=62 /DNA_ID=CAMNT_0039037999 /DNA_START=107 /DNA_END=292 /DNA_ORIENTATION=+